MKTLQIILTILIISAFTVILAYSGLKQRINTLPQDIPVEVRVQIERLQSDLLSERYHGSIELGKMGEKAKAAIPYLIDVLPSPRYTDPWASIYRPGLSAAEALDKIDPDWRNSDAAKEAVKKAIDIINNRESLQKTIKKAIYIINNRESLQKRKGAIFTLTKIENDDAIEALIADKKLNWKNNKPVQKSVSELIALMQNAEKCSPRKIISQLGESGDKSAVQPLIDMMNKRIVKDHSCSTTKRAVATALGTLKDPRAVESLINALFYGSAYFSRRIKDLNPKWSEFARFKGQRFLREQAAWALGEIGDKRAAEPLILVLKHLGDTGQSNAAEALGKIGDKRAVAPLVQNIISGSDRIGNSTIKALDKIEPDWRKSSELKEVSSKAISILQIPYDFHDRAKRRGAVFALSTIGDPRGVGALITALKDPHDYRFTAAKALDKIEPDWQKSKGTEAARLFYDAQKIFLYTARTWDDREAAVFAMHLADEKLALNAIIDAVKKDADKVAVDETARVLGKIGDKRAIEPLIIMLSYANDWYTTGEHPFLEALEKLDPDWRSSEAAMNAIPEIIKTLLDNKGRFNDIDSAATTLGEIGDKSAVTSLLDVLEDSGVKEHYKNSVAYALGEIGDKRAVEPLINALDYDEDYDDSLRGSIATALGEIGDERGTKHIIPLLKDRNGDVRDIAAVALGKIGDKSAVIPLIETINDDTQYGMTYQITGSRYYGLFPSESLRVKIIGALGEIGGDEAIKVLKDRAKNDPYYEARKAASIAIGKITQ